MSLAIEAAAGHAPLRITAWMGEPVVYYGDGMHFDGPLSWAAHQAATPEERDALPPSGGPTAHDYDLPLARWRIGEAWGWCASAVHADWQISSKTETRKRTPLAEMSRYASDRTVNTSSGPFKPLDKTFPTLLAERLVWYALGDRAAVVALLELVTHVGKLSGHGNGRVLRWEVEEAAEDWSRERASALTRRMPHAFRPAELPNRGGLRAPYHHLSRQAPCVDPDYRGLRP